jgi:hypothetical protein
MVSPPNVNQSIVSREETSIVGSILTTFNLTEENAVRPMGNCMLSKGVLVLITPSTYFTSKVPLEDRGSMGFAQMFVQFEFRAENETTNETGLWKYFFHSHCPVGILFGVFPINVSLQVS